jgi:hypothetical protein
MRCCSVGIAKRVAHIAYECQHSPLGKYSNILHCIGNGTLKFVVRHCRFIFNISQRDNPAVGAKIWPDFAKRIRRRASGRGDKRHLDEVVITIAGERHYLWRAVDQGGFVLDVSCRAGATRKPPSTCFARSRGERHVCRSPTS